MMWMGEIRFLVSGHESVDELESHLDEVLDFLGKDDRVVDPDYMATLVDGEVEWCLSVEASGELEAHEIIFGALRAAIHAADGATPGWEERYRVIRSGIRDAALANA